jgi:hypothetical protein
MSLSSSFTDKIFSKDPTTNDALLFTTCIVIMAALSIGTCFLVKRCCSGHNKQNPVSMKDDLETGSTLGRASSISSNSSTQKSFVEREKELFYADTYGPPTSPPPAIHLTLPEEHEDGTKSNARVVIVSIGPHGEIGLSPLEQEQLPAYQEIESGQMQSLDIARMGGLKEASSN